MPAAAAVRADWRNNREARVGALERRLSAVRLMTAEDAAADARVKVETILRPVRAGELSAARYVGRSPRDLSRCPQQRACHRLTGSAGFVAAPRVVRKVAMLVERTVVAVRELRG